MVEIYEDNGGGIHAVVRELQRHKNGVKTYDVVNIISGFEDCLLTGEKFIEVAKEDFPYADAYEPERYEGRDMNYVASELKEYSDLIAIFDDDGYKLFPKAMGIAGKELFEIKEDEEE